MIVLFTLGDWPENEMEVLFGLDGGEFIRIRGAKSIKSAATT